LQGKIVYGGTFNGNEEEGKKEETLTVGETIPRKQPEFFTGLLREAPLKRLFRGGQRGPGFCSQSRCCPQVSVKLCRFFA
jgi:hypothetical protein